MCVLCLPTYIECGNPSSNEMQTDHIPDWMPVLKQGIVWYEIVVSTENYHSVL